VIYGAEVKDKGRRTDLAVAKCVITKYCS